MKGFLTGEALSREEVLQKLQGEYGNKYFNSLLSDVTVLGRDQYFMSLLWDVTGTSRWQLVLVVVFV